jgi:hypothetical protein
VFFELVCVDGIQGLKKNFNIREAVCAKLCDLIGAVAEALIIQVTFVGYKIFSTQLRELD